MALTPSVFALAELIQLRWRMWRSSSAILRLLLGRILSIKISEPFDLLGNFHEKAEDAVDSRMNVEEGAESSV